MFSKIVLFLVFATSVHSMPVDDNLRFSRANSHHSNLNVNYTHVHHANDGHVHDLDDSISKQQQSSNAIGRNLDLQRQNVQQDSSAQVGIQSVVPQQPQPQPQPQAVQLSSHEQVRVGEQINREVPQQQPIQIAEQRPVERNQEQPRVEAQQPIIVEAQPQQREQIPINADEPRVQIAPIPPKPISPIAPVVPIASIVPVSDQAQVKVQEPVRSAEIPSQVQGQEPVRVIEPVRVEAVPQAPAAVVSQSDLRAPEPVRVEAVQAPIIADRPIQVIDGQSPVPQPVVQPVVQVVIGADQVPAVVVPNQVGGEPVPVDGQVVPSRDSQSAIVVDDGQRTV